MFRRSSTAIGDPWTVDRGVDDSRLQPRITPFHDPGYRVPVAVVTVAPKPREQRGDSYPGLFAERVGELNSCITMLCFQAASVDTGRAHREQFRSNIHDAAEEHLSVLQPSLPSGHPVEG